LIFSKRRHEVPSWALRTTENGIAVHSAIEVNNEMRQFDDKQPIWNRVWNWKNTSRHSRLGALQQERVAESTHHRVH
jgi:hypothetical protein